MTITEVLGFALGVMGMRMDDFCRLTIPEYEAAVQAWTHRRQADVRDAWEAMRLHAALTLQPHASKPLRPQQLLRFPWDTDRQHATSPSREKMTYADRQRSAREFLERVSAANKPT